MALQESEVRDPKLIKHLKSLNLLGCLCLYRFGGLGVLYGISMGEGWIRIDTARNCSHHAPNNVTVTKPSPGQSTRPKFDNRDYVK